MGSGDCGEGALLLLCKAHDWARNQVEEETCLEVANSCRGLLL